MPEEEEEEAAPPEEELLCKKETAREMFASPWSSSSLETERASLALAEEEEDPMLDDDDDRSSLAVPQTPSVTNASTCLVSSKVSITRRKLGCLTRARAVAPARAAASAASPSSGKLDEASRTRLSRSQTLTRGRAAAEPGLIGGRERERSRR